MSAIQGFTNVAPYLTHPLVLSGFALLLFFGIHKTLIRSGIIPPLSARSSSKIVQILLRYGFVVALLVIVLGFALEFFKIGHETDIKTDLQGIKTQNENIKNQFEDLFKHLKVKTVADAITTSFTLEEDRKKALNLIRDAEIILKEAGKEADPDNYYLLGKAYLTLGQVEKAIAPLLAAINTKPEMGEAYLGLGVAYQLQANEMIRQENFGQAEDALNKADRYVKTALQYEPADPFLHVQLGYVNKELAQRYSATGKSKKAQANIEKATTHFKMAIGANDNNASAHNGLGSVYVIQRDYDRAIKASRKATELEPKYLFAYYDLAMAYYGKVRSSKSKEELYSAQLGFLEAYQTVLSLDGKDPAAGRLPPIARQNINKIANSVLQEVRTSKR